MTCVQPHWSVPWHGPRPTLPTGGRFAPPQGQARPSVVALQKPKKEHLI